MFQDILKYFKIEEIVKDKLTYSLLKYGDSFVELVNLEDVSVDSRLVINQLEILHENKTVLFEDYSLTPSQQADLLLKRATEYQNTVTINEQFDTLFNDKNLTRETKDEIENIDENILGLDYTKLKDIYINVLNEEQIHILEHDGELIGYLVIDTLNDNFVNKSRTNINATETKTFVDKMLADIVGSYIQRKNFGKTVDESVYNNKNLKIALYKKILENQSIKVRIVSPENIIRLSARVNKYYPYGTGVLDNALKPANNELLSNSATLIGKIARTPILRNWNMEIGSRKNESNNVQKFKNNMANRNVSYDDLFNLKTRSRLISAYEDVVTITKQGKRYLDLEQIEFPRMADTTNIDENLKQKTIEALDVPSSYLGIGDNVQLREEIVATNVIFANEIDKYQTLIEDFVLKLINKIFLMITSDKNVSINKVVRFELNHPIILKVQAYEQVINSISSMSQTIKQSNIDIDPILFFKSETPHIDWDNLITESKISKMKNQLVGNVADTDSQQMGQEGQVVEPIDVKYEKLVLFDRFDKMRHDIERGDSKYDLIVWFLLSIKDLDINTLRTNVKSLDNILAGGSTL